MREGDPARGGAIWCEQHERWECAKRGKSSPICHGIAVAGIDACRMHGGQPVEVLKAKGEAMTAWSALGGPVTVTHTQAVLGMLQMAWLRVHFYAGLLREQVEAEQDQAAGGELGGEDQGGGGRGSDGVGRGAGLIGHTYGAVKDIGVYATGEAVRGLTKLESDERDRVVRFAKTAHDMKIDDQQIRLAEGQGVMLAAVIRGSLDAHLGRVLAVLGECAEAERIRQAWPGWAEQIVPAQIEAVAGGEL